MGPCGIIGQPGPIIPGPIGPPAPFMPPCCIIGHPGPIGSPGPSSPRTSLRLAPSGRSAPLDLAPYRSSDWLSPLQLRRNPEKKIPATTNKLPATMPIHTRALIGPLSRPFRVSYPEGSPTPGASLMSSFEVRQPWLDLPIVLAVGRSRPLPECLPGFQMPTPAIAVGLNYLAPQRNIWQGPFGSTQTPKVTFNSPNGLLTCVNCQRSRNSPGLRGCPSRNSPPAVT